MYDNISTKELIKYLILALFDGNGDNPEIRSMIDEVKGRTSLGDNAPITTT